MAAAWPKMKVSRPAWLASGPRLDVDQEGDAGGEPGRKHDAHGGVLLDAGGVGDDADEIDAEPTGNAGADQQQTQIAAGEQKGDRDAR